MLVLGCQARQLVRQMRLLVPLLSHIRKLQATLTVPGLSLVGW